MKIVPFCFFRTTQKKKKSVFFKKKFSPKMSQPTPPTSAPAAVSSATAQHKTGTAGSNTNPIAGATNNNNNNSTKPGTAVTNVSQNNQSVSKTQQQAQQQQQQQQQSKRREVVHLDVTPTQQVELRKAFDLFDKDGSGRMAASELRVALRALGFECGPGELKLLLQDVGVTSLDATLDFSEFKRALLLKAGERESKEEVLRAFKMLDYNDNGVITFEDLKSVCDSVGHNLTDDELVEMIVFVKNTCTPSSGATGGAAAAAASGGGAWKDMDAASQNLISSGQAENTLFITQDEFMLLMKRAGVY
jgi:centrin-1